MQSSLHISLHIFDIQSSILTLESGHSLKVNINHSNQHQSAFDDHELVRQALVQQNLIGQQDQVGVIEC